MTKYIVMEVQTFPEGNISTPSYAYDKRESAEAKYHAILASAAVSQLPKHSAALMTNECHVLETRCYEHEVAEVSGE